MLYPAEYLSSLLPQALGRRGVGLRYISPSMGLAGRLRIKKIAYGWNDKGVTKVARIILKRFANASEWENYWQKRMNMVGNVVVTFGNYKSFSQNLGQ